MPRRRRNARRAAELTSPQTWELLLVLGSFIEGAHYPSHFADDDERREAWFANIDKLTTNVGTRPAAWWRYEAGIDSPRDELLWLAQHGALTTAEEATVLGWAATGDATYAPAANVIRERRGLPPVPQRLDKEETP